MNFQRMRIFWRASWVARAIFIGLGLAVVVLASAMHYHHGKIAARQRAEALLQGMAEMKAGMLSNWLHERMGDANQIFQSQLLVAHLEKALNGSTPVQAQVNEWLRSLQNNYFYNAIVLYDNTGQPVCGVAGSSVKLPPADEEITGALAATNVVFVDFHREPDGRLQLGFLVPVKPETADGRAMGVLAFWVDPNLQMYPQLGVWPSWLKTAEVVLVRHDSHNEAELLSPLRYHREIPVCSKIPIATSDSPLAQALRGKTGVVYGKGLRGVQLMSAIHVVSDSPWFVIAKVDDDEVIASAWTESVYFGLIMALMIGLTLSIAALASRQQRLRTVKSQLQIERRFQEAQRIVRMGSWTYDLKSRQIECSPQVFQLFKMEPRREPLDFSRQRNLFTHNSWALLKNAADRAAQTSRPYEIELEIIRADGTHGWMLVHGESVRNGGGEISSLRGVALDITRRKQAELSLIDAQLFAISTLNSLTAKIVILDAAGVIISVNHAWRQLAHDAADDPKMACEGANYLEVSIATDSQDEANARAIRQGVRSVLAGETKEFGFEYSCQTRAGLQWFAGRATRFAGSGTARMVVAHEDITSLKQSISIVEESERRFRQLAQQSSTVIWEANPEGLYTYVSEMAESSWGYTPEEIIGRKHFYDLHPEAGREEFKARALAVIQAREVFKELSNPLQCKDGKIIWASTNAIPNVDEHGRLLGYRGATMDITERKEVEERSRRLMVAIDQSAEAIVFTDAEGRILYVNQGFEKITGYTRQEAIGKNPRILKSDRHPSDFYKAMWETICSGEVWHGRLFNRRKDGAVFEEEATISPIHNDAGAIVGYVAVKRDVTREAMLEKQLIEVQKMEAIGQLAGGVAHDYNNILAATIIQLGMLIADQSLSPDVQDSLHELKRGADRAASLTRQLLLFSRRQAMQKKPLELHTLLDDSLKMLRRLIGEHIALVVESRPGDAWIEGDPGMIEQVVMNLCINARDAMPDGGRLTLSIRNIELQEGSGTSNPEARPGKFVCLSVNDEGTGMSEQTMGRIFEPFFTTKGVGKGTGLGLATVHGIAKQHGGWVEVTSELGKGSEFRVFLPSTASGTGAAAGRLPGEIKGGKETILVVEDDADVRRPLALALRFAGFQVFEAETGVEAFKSWHERLGQVDLLLTDMVMPGGMNGLQLAESFRKIKTRLPVIISSGYSNVLVDSGMADGRQFDYIAKPYDMSQLTKLIRECLERKK